MFLDTFKSMRLLYAYFLSNESDRYGWFISDSSVRANLDLSRFEEIIFQIPPIEIQKKYIKIYRAIYRVEELNLKIKDICPVLIKGSLEEVAKSEKV